MKKILTMIIAAILLCGCSADNNAKVITEKAEIKEEYNYGESMTVTRALAAKMVCLIFMEQEECKENNFKDVEEDMWFYDYANLMYENSIMVGNEGNFSPLEPVKYIEAMKIIKRLGGKDVEYENKKGEDAISYNLWLEMIEELAESKKIMPEIMEIKIDAVGDGTELELMKVRTDSGIFDYSGLWMDECIGRTITAYITDEDIIAVKKVF